MNRKQSTKKGGTKGKAEGSRPETVAALKRRAEKIIADNLGHDADTRCNVAAMLHILNVDGAGERETALLRESIRKAEAGEPVFDVADIGEGFVKSARLVDQLLNSYAAEFVFEALTDVLREAERRFDVKLWIAPDPDDESATGGYSIQRMARMFRNHESDKIPMEPVKDLPALISAVLTHPDLPESLEDGFGGALNDLFNDLPGGRAARVDYHRDYIALLLDAQKGGAE
jgi:hypothetical protein